MESVTLKTVYCVLVQYFSESGQLFLAQSGAFRFSVHGYFGGYISSLRFSNVTFSSCCICLHVNIYFRELHLSSFFEKRVDQQLCMCSWVLFFCYQDINYSYCYEDISYSCGYLDACIIVFNVHSQAYLQKLAALEKQASFQHVTFRCICTLLDAVPYFNFRESLLGIVIRNISSSDDVVRLCYIHTLLSLMLLFFGKQSYKVPLEG